jgi:CheY-like chemotaxis protein
MCTWEDVHVIAGYRGGEVLRELRDKSATAGVPVAILSAEVSPASIRRMLLDSLVAGHDHGADPALRAGPAP